MLRALAITKIQKRSLLPKDIWKLKGIMSGGTDTNIYRDKIEYYWGFKPLEGYATTEFGNLAMQSWKFRGMTFFPDAAFFECIPIEEHRKNQEDPSQRPGRTAEQTVGSDDVQNQRDQIGDCEDHNDDGADRLHAMAFVSSL